MKKIIHVSIICLLVFGCKKNVNVPLSFDYGYVKEGVYDNTYFKFKLPVNPDWYVLNNEEAEELYESGKDIASGDNESLKKALDASMINVAKLFNVFKSEPGTVTTFNPSIIINAENLKNYPNVDTPEKYLDQAKEMFRQSAMDIEYIEEKKDVHIGSQDFVFMSVKNKTYGVEVLQDYYVTLKERFAVAFIMSYMTEADKKELYEMFNKLKI